MFYYYNNFMEYCIEKNNINYKLHNHYEQRLFRKLKLNRFTNTQKSELKMVNNLIISLRRLVGSPENTVFVMGEL